MTWDSPTFLWTFTLLMRAGETRNSLNARHWEDNVRRLYKHSYNLCDLYYICFCALISWFYYHNNYCISESLGSCHFCIKHGDALFNFKSFLNIKWDNMFSYMCTMKIYISINTTILLSSILHRYNWTKDVVKHYFYFTFLMYGDAYE